jgi:hypothetical protein
MGLWIIIAAVLLMQGSGGATATTGTPPGP